MKTNNTTSSPFKTQLGREVFTDEVTKKSPTDLVIALFAIALCFGVDRVENAVKATYTQQDAAQILSAMNVALRAMPIA